MSQDTSGTAFVIRESNGVSVGKKFDALVRRAIEGNDGGRNAKPGRLTQTHHTLLTTIVRII